MLFFALFFLVKTNAQSSGDSIYILPAGLVIYAKMDNGIGSKFSSVNDTFTLTISRPVIVRQIELLPVGSVIEGSIIAVKKASAGNQNGFIQVKLETLRLPNGVQRSINAEIIDFPTVKSEETKRIALFSLIGGALGAVVGGASGKEKHTILIGTGAGAALGAGIAAALPGKDLLIKSGEELKIRLNKEVVLPSQDF